MLEANASAEENIVAAASDWRRQTQTLVQRHNDAESVPHLQKQSIKTNPACPRAADRSYFSPSVSMRRRQYTDRKVGVREHPQRIDFSSLELAYMPVHLPQRLWPLASTTASSPLRRSLVSVEIVLAFRPLGMVIMRTDALRP